MDNSFTLLSSMFPKLTKSNKKRGQNKAPTKLALKKHVRRSSMFDNLPSTTRNNGLKLVEDTDTIDSMNSSISPNIVNDTPITISDSDSVKSKSSNCEEINTYVNIKPRSNCLLSTSKYNAIDKWISEINLEMDNNKFNSYQNNDINADVKEQNIFQFDEMLKTLKDTLKTPISNKENMCKEDLKNNGSNKTDCYKNDEVSSISSSDVVEDSDNSLQLDLSSQKSNRVRKNLLSKLYGDKWKIGNDLSKSEPRTRKNINEITNKNIPKTERKPKSKKSLLYKNPYLEFEKQQLNIFPTNEKPVESPWVKYLKGLCDTDSSEQSSKEPVDLLKGVPRLRLSFSDNEPTEKGFSKNNISNPSTKQESNKTDTSLQNFNRLVDSDKENFSDFSESSETLEDRLRRKLDLNKKATSSVSTERTLKKPSNNLKTLSKVDNDVCETNNKLPKSTNLPNTKTPNTGRKTKKKPVTAVSDFALNDLINKTPNLKSAATICSDSIVLKSFLASLSGSVKPNECDPSALIFRNNFKLYKNELATKLFKLYNKEIFDNRIPEDSPIEWSDRMRGTAGYCYCKKVIRRTGVIERKIRIVLATKVLDSADRLRDTLIHEMCHAATWIINEVANGHGNQWRAWTMKAREVFPELPPIKVCHNYAINTKYTYKCTSCFYSFGRHTKSVDTEKKRCGYCYGKFEIFINKTSKSGETRSVPVTPKKAVTGFALFVKENYATYKTPQLNHAQVMKLLGEKFNELRISILRN
ncbi:hypothetical protein ILUMI_11638 [Ignelater luminosus]|uniref:SprT-like domain-containing protein n=1 Tax=Ignelater luminosus TaxID=2038154 RepID=A0A8K0CZY3_IGNLU|nr:hypothetical protein ILUMI_11638 [Ignelater luminosus]